MLRNSVKKALQISLSSLVMLPVMAAGANAFDLGSLKDGSSSEMSAEDREIKLDGLASQEDIDFILDTYEHLLVGLGDYQLAYVSRPEDMPNRVRAQFFLEGEGADNWNTAIFLLAEKIPKKAEKDPDVYTILYIQTFMDSIYKGAEVRVSELVKGASTPIGLTTYKYDHNNGDTEYALSMIWRQVNDQITNMQFVRKNQENTKEDYDNFEEMMQEIALKE